MFIWPAGLFDFSVLIRSLCLLSQVPMKVRSAFERKLIRFSECARHARSHIQLSELIFLKAQTLRAVEIGCCNNTSIADWFTIVKLSGGKEGNTLTSRRRRVYLSSRESRELHLLRCVSGLCANNTHSRRRWWQKMCRRAYIWINSYIFTPQCVCGCFYSRHNAQRCRHWKSVKMRFLKLEGKGCGQLRVGTLLKAVNTILAYFVVKCCRFFACMQQGRDENDVYTITYTKQIVHSQSTFIYT